MNVKSACSFANVVSFTMFQVVLWDTHLHGRMGTGGDVQ